MKKFNTTGICIPSKHYMVDLTERVAEIRKLIDAGEYFTINRSRQYGKTTTLNAVKDGIKDTYTVINLDFQSIGNAGFSTEVIFVQEFCRLIWSRRQVIEGLSDGTLEFFRACKEAPQPVIRLGELFDCLTDWCSGSEKPVVLLIDEVDTASNNQVFLDFLAQLRESYISRDSNGTPAFQSVILAGVTDIKHLKRKIRDDEDAKENSPWNIAADFNIDMSLSEAGIRGMLDEYEKDHHTGMDTATLAKQIRDYTTGYPFLVSRICELIDKTFVPDKYDTLNEAWTEQGIDEAVKSILSEDNTLFDSIMGKLRDMPKLRGNLRRVLFSGETIAHLPDDDEQKQLRMYGFIVNDHNTVAIANRIFEMRLYNYFIGESSFSSEMRGNALDNKPEFIKGNELDIPLIMERFIETQKYIRDVDDEIAEKRFIEEEGREKFLTYLSPIINGVGTFSIEEQTRNRRRMDVVIHYHGHRYIIEMKIWRGDRYNEKGEEQIRDYLDYFGLDTGYMLSFRFNNNKETGVKRIEFGEKVLYEGIV